MQKEIKNRYRAFWNREAADRALLSIKTPKAATADAVAGESTGAEIRAASDLQPLTPAQKWTDIALRHRQMEHTLASTNYFGEAFPHDWVNFGPGALAAMVGGSHTWAWDTVWFGLGRAPIQNWEDLSKVRLDENSEVYRLVTEMTRVFCEKSKGRYITGMSDLGGNLDIVASLRNTQDLLTDIYDHPDEILRAVTLVDDLFETVYTRLHAMLRQSGQDGMSTWVGLWNDKRYYPLQCDFSAMISPDAFARFVMPSLNRSVGFLDNSLYHLDGAGELPHLDHLLSIERLDGIQWVPGDGAAPMWDDCWFPYYERIQGSGKNLVLLGFAETEHVLKMLRNLSHRGLYIDVWLQSEEEAEEVLRKAGELARARSEKADRAR